MTLLVIEFVYAEAHISSLCLSSVLQEKECYGFPSANELSRKYRCKAQIKQLAAGRNLNT